MRGWGVEKLSVCEGLCDCGAPTGLEFEGVRGAMVATGGAVVAGGGVGALYYLDEGFRRSMVFWGEAFPIYLHYEAIHQATKGKSDQ
eukprot:1342716-Amorphochlora_amoeboformis.AAC.2